MAAAIAVLLMPVASASDTFPDPGLYRVEVRIALPNVQESAEPMIVTRCIDSTALKSGQAFFVLSENPLAHCDLLDYAVNRGTATYRIACPGPNRGRALAVFQTTHNAWRGSIEMNLGGKNMTMSETQSARRIGECQ
jgi:hypothetical protein